MLIKQLTEKKFLKKQYVIENIKTMMSKMITTGQTPAKKYW